MKFMIIQNYGGVEKDIPTLPNWKPEDIEAHMAYQVAVGEELERSGELVGGEGLASPSQAKFVRSDGTGAPVVTDGPFPESKELVAGYRIVDVDSLDRAIEIAAKVSAAPGPDGEPIEQAIEVREVMSEPPSFD
jgi:hypothetical protein